MLDRTTWEGDCSFTVNKWNEKIDYSWIDEIDDGEWTGTVNKKVGAMNLV